MSQTTLSILALATAMLIAVAQIRWTVQTQHRLVDDELEVMASGIARQILEYAESRSFDESTTPPVWPGTSSPPTVLDFDFISGFGNTPDCNFADLTANVVECDDIDDLDMAAADWQEVPFVMQGDTMKFEVNVQVYYVDDLTPETRLTGSNRSESKEVVVKVRSPLQVQQSRFTDGLVTLRRLFVYDIDEEELRATYAVSSGSGSGSPTPGDDGDDGGDG